MLLALVLYRFLREPRRGAERSTAGDAAGRCPRVTLTLGETLRVIFRRPACLLLMLGFFGANFVATIFLTWTPTFLVEEVRLQAGDGRPVGHACSSTWPAR